MRFFECLFIIILEIYFFFFLSSSDTRKIIIVHIIRYTRFFLKKFVSWDLSNMFSLFVVIDFSVFVVISSVLISVLGSSNFISSRLSYLHSQSTILNFLFSTDHSMSITFQLSFVDKFESSHSYHGIA